MKIDKLSKRYGKKKAVDSISYSFENKVYGLLGPNGAGKTTLMKSILTLIKCDVHEIDYEFTNDKKKLNRFSGYLPQSYSVLQGLTVYEQLEYMALIKRLKKENIKSEIERVVELVNLSDKINCRCSKLSGGMIRRLGIAQAILGSPKLIIFDEPTTGLDPEERLRFKNVINKIKGDSIIIISTHIVEDVEALCDEILIMKEGKLVASGSQGDIKMLADNKVFEIAKEDYNDEHYIIKEYERDDVLYYRTLSENYENADERKVEPTVEDGYLYAINYL